MESSIKKFNISKVSSVYSGKNGHCCCGCSGKHYYASAHREWASENRGYPVADKDINDRMVKRVVNILNDAAAVDIETDSSTCFSTVVGQRLYIINLRE